MSSPDWSTLEHAYGTAEDVPQHLDDLASGDPDRIGKALGFFWDNIIHQGSVYSASPEVVPFIGNALPGLTPDFQEKAIDLLAALAHGQGWYDVHQHASHLGEVIISKLDDPQAKLAEERDIVRSTTLAVYDEWDKIADCLNGPESVRLAALLALTKLAKCDASEPKGPEVPAPYLGLRPEGVEKGTFANQVVAIAEGMMKDANPIIRANGLAAFFELDQDHPNFGFEQLEHLDGLEHFVALMAASRTHLRENETLTDKFAPHVAKLAHPSAQAAYKDANWGWDGSPRGTSLYLASLLDDAGIDEIADQLVPMLEPNAMQLFEYDTVLAIVLGRPFPKIPDDPCRLSPGRRKLAKAFMKKPLGPHAQWWFWAYRNGNAGAARKRANLPDDRKVWLKWLGLPRWQIGPFRF